MGGGYSFAVGSFRLGLDKGVTFVRGENQPFSVYLTLIFPELLQVFCHPFREEENTSTCWLDPGVRRSRPRTSGEWLEGAAAA